MPIDEYIEHFHNITYGMLRRKYEPRQNSHKMPKWMKSNHESGKFRRIKSRDQPTIIRLADGGIVGYRLPARLVDSGLQHAHGLEKWVEEFGESLPRKIDTCRGVQCVRHYARWVKYDQDFKPRLSQDYLDDGEMARKFFECSQLLWNRATEWFPKHYLERVFRDLIQYPLNDGENRLCGAWTGCAVNVAVDNRPVQTQVHRDVQGFINGMSCLCPFSIFSAGGMVLWELRAMVKLNRGDLFFFMDHLINHSTEKAWARVIQWLHSWINARGFGCKGNIGLKTLVWNPREVRRRGSETQTERKGTPR